MSVFEGSPSASGKKFLVAAARFNRWITDRLARGARKELIRLGGKESDIDTVWVPGSYELPAAARAGAVTGRYAAIVCVGAVIKGETSHDEHIASACASGIQAVMAETGVPVGFGVITAPTFDLASARARLDGGRNMGADAARAAVETASVLEKIKKGK